MSSSSSKPCYAGHIFGETSSLASLRLLAEGSGNGNGNDMTGYIRFSDTNVLAPDYDIPSSIWERARPSTQPERGVWESVYDEYRAQRRAVCGMDVEVWPGGPRERISQKASL